MGTRKKQVKKGFWEGAIAFPTKILDPVKRFLSGEREKLEKRKQELKKVDPFSDIDRLGDNAASDTDASEQVGHEKSTALATQVERRLVQIRKALTRIKIGKYGICENCGKMIDTDRLMIMPETTLCVECGKKKER